jgi:hypothetical protein
MIQMAATWLRCAEQHVEGTAHDQD